MFFREQQKSLGTSVPGHVLAFDPDTQLAQLQIGIKRVSKDGTTVTPAPLIECPIQFAGGGGFHVEHQIDPGDEGIIIFSQRCIDAWIDTGGVAENPILRFHSYSDAYFVPGIRSGPNAITAFANDGIKLRNAAGDKFIWLKGSGDVEVTAGVLAVTGDITATGSIEAPTVTGTTSLKAATAEVVGHVHAGVTSGGDSTSPLV